MRKYHSPLQIFGTILFILSVITFIISLIFCALGKDEGIIPLFVSLLIMFIAYKAYVSGKYKTEQHYGAKYKKDDDENIYHDYRKSK